MREARERWKGRGSWVVGAFPRKCRKGWALDQSGSRGAEYEPIQSRVVRGGCRPAASLPLAVRRQNWWAEYPGIKSGRRMRHNNNNKQTRPSARVGRIILQQLGDESLKNDPLLFCHHIQRDAAINNCHIFHDQHVSRANDLI